MYVNFWLLAYFTQYNVCSLFFFIAENCSLFQSVQRFLTFFFTIVNKLDMNICVQVFLYTYFLINTQEWSCWVIWLRAIVAVTFTVPWLPISRLLKLPEGNYQMKNETLRGEHKGQAREERLLEKQRNTEMSSHMIIQTFDQKNI